MTKIQKLTWLNIKALLPLLLIIVACNRDVINRFDEWCAADQKTVEERGVDYMALREGLVSTYNMSLSAFIAIPLDELEKNGLGLHFSGDTLFYRNHILGNEMYDLLYPVAPDTEGSDQIGEEESCFYRGMDYCFSLLVMDLPEGVKEIPLPYLGKEG